MLRTTALFLCISFNALSQTYNISTIAGTDRILDGSLAASVPLANPESIAFDSAGNLYVTDPNDSRIRKISTAGIITTLVGTGIAGFSGDRGPAIQAQINNPGGLAIDKKNNIYFADRNNLRVRRISPDGTIDTVAGNGAHGVLGDGGPALSASITPNGIAVDAQGNLYIGDIASYKIRKVGANGVISTYAGVGEFGYGGDNGPAIDAIIGVTSSLVVDANSNLYFRTPATQSCAKSMRPPASYRPSRVAVNKAIPAMEFPLRKN